MSASSLSASHRLFIFSSTRPISPTLFFVARAPNESVAVIGVNKEVSTLRNAVSYADAQQRRSETSDLIDRIAFGDETAFRLFHDATNGLLFGLLLQVLGHTHAAERALSELYDEIRQNRARFGRQNEGPLTWLLLIAHRRSIECLCSSRPAEAKIDSINITEHRRQIRAAIESIPQSQRRMIELAFFSGMNNLHIALEMGESTATVEDELHSGMLLLLAIFRSVYDSTGLKLKPGSTTEEAGRVSVWWEILHSSPDIQYGEAELQKHK